jgi:hypothetical protein
LDGEDLEFGRREEIEVMRKPVPKVESAACASGEIEGLHEILAGKNLENLFGAGSKNGLDHGLNSQDESPVTGALSRDVPALPEGLSDIAPEVVRKKPSQGFLVSQLQGAFDDILFVFLKIEAGRVGIPEQRPRDFLFLPHDQYYITVPARFT